MLGYIKNTKAIIVKVNSKLYAIISLWINMNLKVWIWKIEKKEKNCKIKKVNMIKLLSKAHSVEKFQQMAQWITFKTYLKT